MKIIVDKLLTNYDIQGSGKVILLLHGWGSNMKIFDGLVASLSKDYSVVRLDLPGFGSSQKPEGAWRIVDYAKFLKKFCSKINFSPEVLIGHSFGGRIIIKMVAQKIEEPKKIILIDSAGIKEPDSVKNKLFMAVAKAGKTVTRLPGLKKSRSKLRSRLYKSANSSDYLESGEMKQIFLNAINEDLTNDAKKVTQPTLLIWGEEDNETPLRQAHVLNKQIKNSQLEILEGGGHFVFLDLPLRTLGAIKHFL